MEGGISLWNTVWPAAAVHSLTQSLLTTLYIAHTLLLRRCLAWRRLRQRQQQQRRTQRGRVSKWWIGLPMVELSAHTEFFSLSSYSRKGEKILLSLVLYNHREKKTKKSAHWAPFPVKKHKSSKKITSFEVLQFLLLYNKNILLVFDDELKIRGARYKHLT